MRISFLTLWLTLVCSCSQEVVSEPGRGPNAGWGGEGAGASRLTSEHEIAGIGESISLPDARSSGLQRTDGGAGVCGITEFLLDRSPVDVLLVLDVSGSLDHYVSTGGTLYSNLYKAVRKVVSATEGDLDWGVKPFPAEKFCSVSPTIDVPVGPLNYPAIDALLTKHTPAKGDGTPTGTAIDEGVKYLKNLKSGKPQYMVLATDGEPNCPIRGSVSSVAGHVQTVRDAYDQGIVTYVIGISESVRSSGTLNQMAVAGGRPRKVDPMREPLFFIAQDETEVVNVMQGIANQLIRCVFALDAPPYSVNDVAADLHKRGSTEKGQRIPRDPTHVDGWDYVDSSYRAMELFGSWCSKVEDEGTQSNEVRFIFGCPGITIP
jgi:hypothetical protein